jgi:predicted dehydrogenase
MRKPISVGMIGGGLNSAVGRVHKTALQLDGLFSLKAGCFSRDPAINLATGTAYGVEERTYDNYRDMLENERGNLDAIIVATPIFDHYPQICDALESNYIVISDKPLFSSSIEFRLVNEKFANLDKRLFSIFNYTGYPAVREMRRRIRSGSTGNIFKIVAEMPQDTFLRLKNTSQTTKIQQWRLQRSEISCLSLDLFVHLHSIIHFLTGKKPLQVFSKLNSVSQVTPELIDDAQAIITYSNNLTVSAWYSKVALGSRNGLRIRAYGTNGSLEWYQESPEVLRIANSLGDTFLLDRASTDAAEFANENYSRFKAGHPSGFIEAFSNYYYDLYESITTQKTSEYIIDLSIAGEGLHLAEAIERSGQLNTLQYL